MPQSRRQFVRTLFLASQAAVATRWICPNVWAAPKPDLCFLVVGDWGRRGDPNQLQVAKQMERFAHEHNARFVISTGDNFYNDGVTSTEDSHWKESFESVYKGPSLQIPWYAVLGNHDHRGNVQAQIDYKSPRWRMPARYFRELFRIDAGNQLELFFLDTTPMLNRRGKQAPDDPLERERQLSWLEQSLTASRARWKMVIGHHPIYSGGVHGERTELVEYLLPILLRQKADLYVHGHDHDLQHLREGTLEMFCSGAGSQIRETKATARTRFAKSSAGFMSVRIGSDLMRISMTDNRGTLLYETEITKTGGAEAF